MERLRARVLENEAVRPTLYRMVLEAPPVARAVRPGQFVMVVPGPAGSLDPLLPRPFSVARFDPEAGWIELIYEVVGRGTAWMAAMRPGEGARIWGPLGRPFDLRPRTRRLLLVAGGIGIAPFLGLALEAAAREVEVVLAYGAATASRLLDPALFPPAVEVRLATDDGTLGHKGFVTELLEDAIPWAEQIFGCGPEPMLRALAGEVRRRRLQVRPGMVQLSLEARMGCGIGVCLGCVVRARKGYLTLCTEGPVVDLIRLGW